jgi:hypothetical protein
VPELDRARVVSFRASSGLAVSDVRILPGRSARWLATVSKGIWSTFKLWRHRRPDRGSPYSSNMKILDGSDNTTDGAWAEVAQWSPRGAIFKGFALNDDPNAEGLVAIGVADGRYVFNNTFSLAFCSHFIHSVHTIEILALQPASESSPSEKLVLSSIKSIVTAYVPITFSGPILAAADSSRTTSILNILTDASATLRSAEVASGHGPPGLLVG